MRTDMGGPGARLGIADSIPNLADTMDAQAENPSLRYLNYPGRRAPWWRQVVADPDSGRARGAGRDGGSAW